MIKDLPENIITDVGVAAVLLSDEPETMKWGVYLLNFKDVPLENVVIRSTGYGLKDNEEVKTSVFRHFFEEVSAQSYKAIEAIDPAVFGLTNEYWVSFYIGNVMYDKKYYFLPESIVDTNITRIPLLDKPGIMIK